MLLFAFSLVFAIAVLTVLVVVVCLYLCFPFCDSLALLCHDCARALATHVLLIVQRFVERPRPQCDRVCRVVM